MACRRFTRCSQFSTMVPACAVTRTGGHSYGGTAQPGRRYLDDHIQDLVIISCTEPENAYTNMFTHKLWCLLQSIRGQLWKGFLNIQTKRLPGVYEKLVSKALGKRFSGKVRNCSNYVRDTTTMHDGTPCCMLLAINPSVCVLLQKQARDVQQVSQPAESGAAQTQQSRTEMPLQAEGSIREHADCSSAATAKQVAQSPFSLDIAKFVQIALEDKARSSADGAAAKAGSAQLSGKAEKRHAAWQHTNTDWNMQIEKDLHRTFPGHPVMDSSGRNALRRMLAAYARRNPSVGYCQVAWLRPHLMPGLQDDTADKQGFLRMLCRHGVMDGWHMMGCGRLILSNALVLQGMNFVAGCLLLFMDEEDAFWSLACIIEDLLPGYFSTAMVEPQVTDTCAISLPVPEQLLYSAYLDMSNGSTELPTP